MKIIVANGPPRSGKDTVIAMLKEKLILDGRPVFELSYKWVLCKAVGERYGLSALAVWELNADTDSKDEPSDLFDGKSVRQALIYESEDVIKVKHGPVGVAKLAFFDLQTEHGPLPRNAVVLNPDGGFEEELGAFRIAFNVEPEDAFVIRMDRKGITFKGDSRGYISNPNLQVQNDGTLEELEALVLPTLQSFIDTPEAPYVMKGIPN